MGKISAEAKLRYAEKVKEYRKSIEQILIRERNLLEAIRRDPGGAAYKRLQLVEDCLNMVSYFLLLNHLSIALLGIKNEAYLNDARKGCYKGVIYLEQIVTPHVDVPFSEYERHLAEIADIEDENRYELLRKLGFAIHSVIDGFGDNTKWKWSFVELEARYAVISKNMINLKTFIAGLDPRIRGYEARIAHLQLTKRLLQQSADRFREKYELSTLRIDDFKQAIGLLSALKRLHLLLGEHQEAEIVKKKIEIWTQKMDADEKKLEEQARDSRLQRKT